MRESAKKGAAVTARIEVDGYINQIKRFDWGTVLTVASNNSVKNAEGKWETASRDYYDVVLGDGVSLGDLQEDERVIVAGTFKLGKNFAKKDGSTGVELKVRATSVTKAKPRQDEEPF
jgi:hypothetical protein